jgi:DNA-binding LacI/PurR family transcriptional regulator
VSITTVSHALNHTRYVSPVTRAAIQAIAQRLGYRPDPVARMLQGGESLLIGHVLSALANNFFFGLVARGADLCAQESGYATIISYTDGQAESERKAVRLLLEKRVNGLIFTTPIAAENVELAVAAGVATVMIERPLKVRGAHAVVIDHHQGFYALTNLLIQQGHSRLAFIGGELSQQGSYVVERQRLKGFKDALSEAGLTVPPACVEQVPYYDTARTRAACRAVLDYRPMPTGLVMGSDLLASGALQVLYERRLRVPEDVSVVSFDNTLGPYLAPPLTDAEAPAESMGRHAIELIVQHCQRAAAGKPTKGQRVTLQPQLHLRASTAPCNPGTQDVASYLAVLETMVSRSGKEVVGN